MSRRKAEKQLGVIRRVEETADGLEFTVDLTPQGLSLFKELEREAERDQRVLGEFILQLGIAAKADIRFKPHPEEPVKP